MIRVALLSLLFVSIASAQEAPPRERALLERIGLEVNSNLTCSANVAALQDKIKELEAKLKVAPK